MSAGINRDADLRISDEIVEWADTIFVMERSHRTKILRDHKQALGDRRLVVLGVPDNFRFMQDELVTLLRRKMLNYLP